MRVLILGGTGMLGHKLYQNLPASLDTWVTVRTEPHKVGGYGIFCPDRVIGKVDAHDLSSVEEAIATVRPEAVINCIGLVKQQPLARDPATCIEVNALFPHKLAQLCQAAEARLVHVSTDCVFKGDRGGYSEQDPTDADDLYGRTKALGELDAPGALTLRTSIIGRELGAGFGLVEWFLSRRGACARGFTGALFSGLTTNEMSKVIGSVLLQHGDLSGIYQVSSEPIDKHTLLSLLNEEFQAQVHIEPDPHLQLDRTLDSSRFREVTGYCPPPWAEMIREMAADPTPYDSMDLRRRKE